MAQNYWDRVLNRRVTRRRAVVGTSAIAASAAFLAACGSDDDDEPASTGGGSTGGGATGSTGGGATGSTGGGATGGGSTGGGSGLITQPVQVAPAQAKRGGVLRDLLRGEMRNIDPFSGQAGLNDVGDRVMSSLFTETPAALERSGHVLQGDLADSWEVAPDGLSVTIKLRQDAKWHDIAPVSGRAFDSEDVLASFDRYKAIGNLGSSIFNEAGPGGFVTSYSAPDANTVQIQFKEPLAWALNWFAPFGGYTATLMMIPKEADNGFDQAQQMIGTGPFFIKEYDPSVKMILARNPEYWDPDWALVDEIEMPIVPEYATRQAQYKAGAIHWARETTLVVRPTDVLAVIGDQPQLKLFQGDIGNTGSALTYGVQTMIDGKNPFADERVRQALSHAYDRDLDIDVQYNVGQFEDAGLPVDVFWNSHLAQRTSFLGGGWGLDPRDEAKFGENAKYFKHDVEEAKALLSAAGYPDGFEVEFRYPHASAFSRETRVEPLFFYLQEIGLSVKQNPQTDYTQDYIPNNRDASGAYPGIGYHSITGGVPSVVDPSNALVAEYHPDAGVTFHGFNDGKGDPALTEILDKMKAEMDPEARLALNHEAQRYLAKAQWAMIEAGTATGMISAWPAVGNFAVWNASPSTWRTYQIFIDDSLAPNA